MSLADFSAHQLAALIRKGEASAEEALDAALERVEAVEGASGSLDGDPTDADGVHAFISLNAERARAQAKAVDATVAKGEGPGPGAVHCQRLTLWPTVPAD